MKRGDEFHDITSKPVKIKAWRQWSVEIGRQKRGGDYQRGENTEVTGSRKGRDRKSFDNTDGHPDRNLNYKG